jgi:sugar (pentulose or hexulose) kinase
MIDLLRLGDLEWPTLAQLNKPYGEAVVNGVTLKVFPAVGDQQLALMGAGLLENELSLNISTGAQVSQIVDQMSVGSHQTRYFFNGKLLETITHIPAGRSLHSIVEVLTEISRSQGLPLGDPWKTMIRLMNESEKFTSNGKLEFGLSFFPSPVGSEGFIRGITLENFSVGKLMLAAVKNLADNLTKCSSILNPNHTWSNVRISGGLSHSLPQLVEYLGSYFGANRISESVVDEETLVGLATLAYSTDFAHANKDGHNVPRQ